MRLFVGDDWAEDHHDVEVMDEAGKVLARRRLPEGVAGMARLHEPGRRLPGRGRRTVREVVVGIETDRGPWVAALVAAGYLVFAVNPLQAARFRERHGGVRGQERRRRRARARGHGADRLPPAAPGGRGQRRRQRASRSWRARTRR